MIISGIFLCSIVIIYYLFWFNERKKLRIVLFRCMVLIFFLFGKKYILVYEWRNGGGGYILDDFKIKKKGI